MSPAVKYNVSRSTFHKRLNFGKILKTVENKSGKCN